ncbi:MAG: hypothetical protein QOH75_2395 [Actinomycetota bacterium]|nr:hypothetical protein [Actinomycetota bacterium]
MRRTVLLSDLHMGAGGKHEQFRADAALAALLEDFAADPCVAEVVLLGDTFDLGGGHPSASAEPPAPDRLYDVLRAHADVVASLRELVRQGTRIHVVQGNHDVELAGVTVRSALLRVLADGDATSVRFHPWLHHVPGVLLAEHGNQHHDINAFDTVLTPLASDDRVADEPFGGQLSRLRHEHRGAHLLPRATQAAAREALRRSGPRRWRRRREYRQHALPRYAADVQLPRDVVLDLDRLGQRHPAAVVARLLSQAARRGQYPGYLVAAAHDVRQALGDAAPPFLVMGHSHAADARLLDSHDHASPMTYLNTGTWSLRGPRPGDTTLPPVTSTWVEVDVVDGSVAACARVLHLAGDGAHTVLAEADTRGRVERLSRQSLPAAVTADYVT